MWLRSPCRSPSVTAQRAGHTTKRASPAACSRARSFGLLGHKRHADDACPRWSDASPVQPQLSLPLLEPVAHEETRSQHGYGCADALCAAPELHLGQGTVLTAEHAINRPA